MLMDKGYHYLFERVRGYNVEVTKYFSKNYVGSSIKLQTLGFELNEGLIAEATRFPIEGERWFKNNMFKIMWKKNVLTRPTIASSYAPSHFSIDNELAIIQTFK